MTATTELARKKCSACEGKEKGMGEEEIQKYLKKVPTWELGEDGRRIRKTWVVKDFMAAMEFFGQVAQVAEKENHHPDLHLTDYRNVAIELSTHAVKGLTENDFIMAAKIDEVPVTLKKKSAK